MLTASENGYGKLTPLDDFPPHGRGGQGVIALQTSDRNGALVAALQVTAGQEIMLISSTGTLVRTPVDEISVLGRNTQGVRLIRLAEGERLTGIERIESLEAARRAQRGARGERCVEPAPIPRPTRSDGATRRRSVRVIMTREGLRARIQFCRGAGGAAPGGARAGPCRTDRLARQRHVGDGGQPPQQGLSGRARQAEADLRELLAVPRATGCCSCRAAPRAQFAAIPLNLAHRRDHRRLRQYRRLVEEGDRRGAALLQGQRRRR